MTKKVITTVLLLFVAATIGYALYDLGRKAGRAEASTPSDKSERPEAPDGRSITVYYFYMKPRCVTCTRLENYAREAVEQGFPEEVKAGRLKFVAVDCDDPENAHFLTDYELETKALVLVAREKGGPDESKNLKEIWDHVRDKPVYLSYVREEIKELLHAERNE